MPRDANVPGAATVEITADDAEIARLAALPLLEYERERSVAAERFSCRIGVLDKLTAKARGGVDIALVGRPLNLSAPEPWQEPVDGGAPFDAILIAIRLYVVLDLNEAITLVLGAVATHLYDVFTIFFPRLAVTSPEKRSGKTTLLDILAALVLRPLLASNISTAAVFRTIETAHPRLLVDEADRFLKYSHELIGVLNAGHRRGGSVARNVETAEGWEPRAFDCFSPAAIAGIGTLPDTLVDRSVRIKLRRKRREEAVQSLRLDRMGDFEMLSRQAARWAHDNRQPVADADPDMPSALYNRVADNWRPLIADAAGGEWAQRARRAAEAAAAEDGDESARTMLLADLRGLFDAEASGVLFTKEILEALSKRDDRPWPEWGKAAKPITGRQLGMLLNSLGIDTNITVRRGEKTGKGYSRDKLEDAFARYLTAVQSVTRSQLNEAAALSNIPSVTRQPYVTDTISENTSVLAGCDRVTDREPVCAEEEVEWTA